MSKICCSCGCYSKDLVSYWKMSWGEHGDEIFHFCPSCREEIEKCTYSRFGKKIQIYKKVFVTEEDLE